MSHISSFKRYEQLLDSLLAQYVSPVNASSSRIQSAIERRFKINKDCMVK